MASVEKGSILKSVMFLFINFLITWGAWITVIVLNDGPLTPDKPVFLLYVAGGLLGPVVAAFASQRWSRSKEEFRVFLRQLIRVRVNVLWYAAILLLPFVLTVIPHVLGWMGGSPVGLAFAQPYYMILLTLPTFIIGGGLEELGWRGVLLPELCKRFSAFPATLILACIWAVWHLPLWFMNGTVQYGSSFGYFAVSVLVFSLLLSAVYLGTGSILLCVLMHAMFNANLAFFPPLAPQDSAWNEPVSLLVKLVLCLAIFFVLVNRVPQQQIDRTSVGIN
jgi:uncharacterized protein